MEENDVPLFGNYGSFNTLESVDVPELSLASRINNLPEPIKVPDTVSVTQSILKPIEFNFPLNPQIHEQFKNINTKSDLSVEDRINNELSKTTGNYKGEVSQREATKYNDIYQGYDKDRNNEDIYSQNKDNFWNGLELFTAKNNQWFASTMHIVEGIYDAAIERDFTKIWNNDFNKAALAQSEGLQYLLPIYKSLDAQDNPWKFWAKGNMAEHSSNFGMVTGGILGTIAQDAILAGAGALLAYPTAGGSVAASSAAITLNTTRNFYNIYKSISALSKLMSVPKLALNAFNTVKSGKSIVDVIKTAATTTNALNFAGNALKTSLIASGEAGFEATITAENVKNKLREINPNATTEEIEKTAIAAGNMAYGINQAILNITLPIEMGRVLTGKLTSNIIKNIPFDIIADVAKARLEMIPKKGFLNTFTNSAVGNATKGLFKQTFTEGAEEGGQFIAQTLSEDYYKDKFANRENFWNSLGLAAKAVTTDEGLANITGGMFIGGLSGAGGMALGEVTGGKYGNDLSIRGFNRKVSEYKEAFERTNNLLRYSDNLNKPLDLKGKGLFEVKTDYDNLVHDMTLFGIKQGNVEARIEAFKELRGATPEAFKESFNRDVNTQDEVRDIVDSITNRMQTTLDSYKEINSAYGVNPFANDNFYQNAISKLSKKTKQNENKLSAAIWEAGKDQAVRQLVNLKNSTNRDEKLTQETSDQVLPQNRALFESFLNSPIQSLNKGLFKTNDDNIKLSKQFSSMLETINGLMEQNQDILSNLPEGFDKALLEKQTLEQATKFYKDISSSIKQNDITKFYKQFYQFLTGIEESDIELSKLNKFIIDTSDIVKLRFGKSFLTKDLIKLQTKEGQKELVQENLDNFAFYTYMDELKEKVENGELEDVVINGKSVKEETTIPVVTTPVPTPTNPVQSTSNNTEPIKSNPVEQIDPIFRDTLDKIEDILSDNDTSKLTNEELDTYFAEKEQYLQLLNSKKILTPFEINTFLSSFIPFQDQSIREKVTFLINKYLKDKFENEVKPVENKIDLSTLTDFDSEVINPKEEIKPDNTKSNVKEETKVNQEDLDTNYKLGISTALLSFSEFFQGDNQNKLIEFFEQVNKNKTIVKWFNQNKFESIKPPLTVFIINSLIDRIKNTDKNTYLESVKNEKSINGSQTGIDFYNTKDYYDYLIYFLLINNNKNNNLSLEDTYDGIQNYIESLEKLYDDETQFPAMWFNEENNLTEGMLDFTELADPVLDLLVDYLQKNKPIEEVTTTITRTIDLPGNKKADITGTPEQVNPIIEESMETKIDKYNEKFKNNGLVFYNCE